jgi:DNA-binding transcriptional ArsR family regulator
MVITSHQILGKDEDENGQIETKDYMQDLKGTKREIMRLVTQKTRANLIQDIIGHPGESVSMSEFEYMNPSKKKATIDEHLRKLVDAGVVEKNKLPMSDRRRDLPYTFYELSPAGRAFLEEHDILIDDQEEIKRQYSKVKKDSEIQKYQEAPRPSN